MITKEEYVKYFGVDTAPKDFERLKSNSLSTLRAIMIENVPTKDNLIYKEFIKALMEQIYYYSINPELMEESGSGGYTLGSYSENASNNNSNNSKSITRVSPVAYDILLNCGLLHSGLGWC